MTKQAFLEKLSLKGKAALITGGSRGIGKAIALAFAEAGADLMLVSRNPEDLARAAQEISLPGRLVATVPADLRHLSEIDRVAEETMGKFGRIDILVNNAGTNLVYDSIFKITEKVWDVTFSLNLKAYFFLSQAVGRIMRDQGGGTIINISSEVSFRPFVGMSVYSISKAGVNMLTQVLAQEFGQYSIRVNAIAPGLARTKLSESLLTDPSSPLLKDSEDFKAMGRLAIPEDIATAALFLASEASSYIMGQVLLVDGGYFVYSKALAKSIIA